MLLFNRCIFLFFCFFLCFYCIYFLSMYLFNLLATISNKVMFNCPALPPGKFNSKIRILSWKFHTTVATVFPYYCSGNERHNKRRGTKNKSLAGCRLGEVNDLKGPFTRIRGATLVIMNIWTSLFTTSGSRKLKNTKNQFKQTNTM